ncbi:MAG: PIN domain-containing protein [Candidatus Peregrinibacteria bacterium]|nr:PIN domain-containing protein [Candidatus Peregrinibacteria bacterium]
MKILDSSVIISIFRQQEKNHKKALQIFISNEKFLIPECVIAEVLTVLKMREGLKTANKCYDFISNTKDVEITPIENIIFNKALAYFSQNKNNLSFVDTILLVLSKENQMELISFDKDLQKAVKKH